MDKNTYEFKSLESKYEGFVAPGIEIVIGSTTIDSFEIPISDLTVDIDAGESAGGCRFTLGAAYDYANSAWLGNVVKSLVVGEKLSIKGGYVKKEPIFYGFVDSYSLDFANDGAPHITVSGIDAKGFLMNGNSRKYMTEKTDPAVIKELLSNCVSKGYAKKLTIGSIEPYKAQRIQENTDDNRFITRLAREYNMSYFIVNGEIIFDDVISDMSTIMKLTLGLSLLSFSKQVSLRRQIAKVIVTGIDPITKKPISGEASSTTIGGSGKTAPEFASGFGSTIEKIENLFVTTPEECERLAQAELDAHALGLVAATGRCIGLPEIIPGRHIEISGLDERSNGVYYISRVTHEFSASGGYQTKFDLKGAKSK